MTESLQSRRLLEIVNTAGRSIPQREPERLCSRSARDPDVARRIFEQTENLLPPDSILPGVHRDRRCRLQIREPGDRAEARQAIPSAQPPLTIPGSQCDAFDDPTEVRYAGWQEPLESTL